MFRIIILAVLALGEPAAASTAQTQPKGVSYEIPLELAVTAAQAAVRSCADQGWAVTAVVTDRAGIIRVQLRGDNSTAHTDVTAFRKAYTVVSMGPIFGFDRSSKFVELVRTYPGGAGSSLMTIPNVIALGGGVGFKRGGHIVAAIGVGGAPGGDKDEACAVAGVAAVHQRVAGE